MDRDRGGSPAPVGRLHQHQPQQAVGDRRHEQHVPGAAQPPPPGAPHPSRKSLGRARGHVCLTRGQPPGFTSAAFLPAGGDGGDLRGVQAVEVKMRTARWFTPGRGGVVGPLAAPAGAAERPAPERGTAGAQYGPRLPVCAAAARRARPPGLPFRRASLLLWPLAQGQEAGDNSMRSSAADQVSAVPCDKKDENLQPF